MMTLQQKKRLIIRQALKAILVEYKLQEASK